MAWRCFKNSETILTDHQPANATQIIAMTREAVTDHRDQGIDALKGLAICLVVLGHSVQANDANFDSNLLFRLIYSFHMPMFMFLSGFILLAPHRCSFPAYIKKNAIRLLVPFLVWYLIGYVAVCFRQDISLGAYLLELARSPGKGLWFLWILFLNKMLLSGALTIARYTNRIHRENYFVIGALLLSLAASSDYLALADVKKYFPYYVAGFFAAKYRHGLQWGKPMIYAVALIAFPLLALAWRRNDFPLFYPALLELINNKSVARLSVSIYKYAVSFAGIAFCAFIVEGIRETPLFKFLGWCGLYTLDIYVCHQYFMIGIGDGVIRYVMVATLSLIFPLVLSLLLLRRFEVTRLLFLG